MLQKFTPLRLQTVFSQTSEWAKLNWIKLFALLMVGYILLQKDLNFSFNLNRSTESVADYRFSESKSTEDFFAEPVAMTIRNGMSARALMSDQKKETPSPAKPVISAPVKISTALKDDNIGNTYSNMTYTFDAKAVKNQSKSGWDAKRKKQERYVNRFAEVSKSEMKKYGIPASITLAQGLIETNAGESKLATKNNNHFGMKCFSKKCGKGHCSNFTDDTHKDFFRKYKTVWESYRAHSQLLMGKRYRHLKKLGAKDYKGWARGLKKAGYATDPRYAEKLINLIEELKLHRFDE